MPAIPDKLRIVDGQIVLADGGDVQAYLREYAIAAGLGPDDPVNVISHDGLKRLKYKAESFGYALAS